MSRFLKNVTGAMRFTAIAAALSLTACTIVEPPPQPVVYQPAPPAIAYAAPPPAYYYPSYPNYYAPPVSLSFGFGGHRGYYGRGRW